MRSAEQQAVFEKFVAALKKYKGKAVDTATLSKLVEKIYKDKLGDKSPAGKLSDLRRSNPEIFKDIKINYSIAGQSDANKAWRNDPEFRKFFKQKRPGVVWDDISVEDRGIKRNTYSSYLYEKSKSKTIPKDFIPYDAFIKKIGVKKNNFKEYESNRKGEYGDLQKKIKKLFPKKKFKKEVFYKDPSTEKIDELKTAISEMQKKGIEKMSAKKSAGSTEPLKAIHRELMLDPDARPIELAEAIYGKANAQTLKDIGNDASKYTEFLTGSRKVPGIKPPSIIKVEEILGNILMPGSGFFNFGNAERRNAMLRERDKVLGITDRNNKLFSTRLRLMKKLKGQGLNIDEAMGLSATYERAPGYSELAQLTSPEINYLKGNTIDKDFSRIFEKVVRGDQNIGEEIKTFNQDSRAFQKNYGIDTPIIEYKPGEKLDASKFVKNFDKLTPEAQANVSQLADQGIALRSRAMPMGALLESVASLKPGSKAFRTICTITRAEGGSVDACVERVAQEPEKFANKFKNLTAESGPLAKVKNAALGFLRSGGVKTFGIGAAVGAGIGLVKAFRNDDPTTYLSNEDQQKNMLVDMATQPISTDIDRPAILDYQLPALGVAAAGSTALAAPSTIRASQTTKQFASRSRAPGVERKPVGKFKTGLRVLGRGLGVAASPALLAPLAVGDLASQVAAGDTPEDIATNPLNYLYPAFADQTPKLTRGLNPTVRKIARLGLPRIALKGLSRAGIGGFAASAMIQGLGLLDE